MDIVRAQSELESEARLGERFGERLGERLGETEKKILVLLANDKTISIPIMAEKLSISTTAIEKHLKKLKSKGVIEHIGPARGGTWKVNG